MSSEQLGEGGWEDAAPGVWGLTRLPPGVRGLDAWAQMMEYCRGDSSGVEDLFTFLSNRQRRRMYLVAYLDDFSRFVLRLLASTSRARLLFRSMEATARLGFT